MYSHQALATYPCKQGLVLVFVGDHKPFFRPDPAQLAAYCAWHSAVRCAWAVVIVVNIVVIVANMVVSVIIIMIIVVIVVNIVVIVVNIVVSVIIIMIIVVMLSAVQ